MPLYKWHTFWMAQCLICYFIGILSHIERKGLLMRNAATILHLRSKSYYASGQKFHYVDIQKYTDICFQRVSSMQFLSVRTWCIAILLSDTKQKKSLLENLYREAGFWLCCGKHIIFNIKWFEVHKISERYGANLYYKTSDLFPLVFLGLVTFS